MSDDSYDRADANTTAGALLPVPVPVGVSVTSKTVVFTKLFSWMTACLLATAVLISLVSVTSERNDLRSQLDAQSSELYCRSEANIDVNFAAANQQIALVHHSVLIGDFVKAVINKSPEQTLTQLASDLQVAGTILDKAGDDLLDAVERQQTALEACQKS